MIRVIKRIFEAVYFRFASKNKKLFEGFLKYKGCKIGKNIWWGKIDTISIDFSRPSLVEIGDNVRINKDFTLMTHDATSWVFKHKYHDHVPCSGQVVIGNNVYFGRHCTVLKGVTIGDNCIIGYGSIVTKSIPSDSVAVGAPAKVVCSLDDYYNKRKKLCVNEGLEYAKSIRERFKREPVIKDFYDDFPLFLDPNELHPDLNVLWQLRDGAYGYYKKNHRPYFNGFEEFIKESRR